MKLWILSNEPPVSEDTAYLLGRVCSRFRDIVVTRVTEHESILPELPDQVDGLLNRSFNISADFLSQMDTLADDRGIPVVNPGRATLAACDKRSYPETYPEFIPRTRIVSSVAETLRFHEDISGTLVIKAPFGKHGKQVERFRGAEDTAVAEWILADSASGQIVAQEFCDGFLEGDKRIILHRVSREEYEIAAWFQRVPQHGGWKSNVSSGGRIQSCELQRDEEQVALEVASRSGLDYVGIDTARHGGDVC